MVFKKGNKYGKANKDKKPWNNGLKGKGICKAWNKELPKEQQPFYNKKHKMTSNLKRSESLKETHKKKQWGFEEGYIPWNTGQTKYTDDRLKSIAKANFKRGWVITKGGYKFIRVDREYIAEHRIVWIRHNKIPIPKGFIVHHRDQDKLNNNIDNLLLLPRDIHTQLHQSYERGTL